MRIHFVGCEGASMKVLRKIAEADGAATTGSDTALEGHDPKFAEGADLLVYSSAVREDNPELIYAREHGIDIMTRAEFLGQTASRYGTTIAVAGSHGKTTVTAMLWSIFEPYDPTVHLGGEYRGQCGHVGGKRFFITEACEYRRNFLQLSPRISVVLNVELDHTDYYADLADITDAFNVFSRSGGVRIVCADDSRSEPLRSGRYVGFGVERECEFRARNIVTDAGGTTFTLVRGGRSIGEIRLKTVGRHNVYNALAATAAATAAGLGFYEIKRGLENFTGVARRLERVGEACGCAVYTDYAHHPSEIASTLTAVREMGAGRVCVVFEPHTYSRTSSLLGDFRDALMLADEIVLADIYAAREKPVKGVSSQLLCRSILESGRKARCFSTYYVLNEYVRALMKKGDAWIYCGAGTINLAALRFVEKFGKK